MNRSETSHNGEGPTDPTLDGNAFLEGRIAYHDYQPVDKNPYPPGSKEYASWQRGWWAAYSAPALFGKPKRE